jgi:hypothetical protein
MQDTTTPQTATFDQHNIIATTVDDTVVISSIDLKRISLLCIEYYQQSRAPVVIFSLDFNQLSP